MVLTYWVRDDLLPFACEIRQLPATFCEFEMGDGDGKVFGGRETSTQSFRKVYFPKMSGI